MRLETALAKAGGSFVELERALCERSLADFVRQAWHVLEPGQPYAHGWHIDAICEHLEAVTNGDITRLLINVPPGTMKSMLVGVFWPAWEWGPKGKASNRIISASHEMGLSVRDARRMRLLITSEWFQSRWPMKMVSDQNQKTYFENDSTGWRQACAVASMTGRRGDVVIWDDPHSVEAALSPTHRETALRVFQETLPTRLNNPASSAIIIIMQRLHEGDVSGLILEHGFGYEHLCLPMQFDAARRCETSIGFVDPRETDGELLFPERFPQDVVERDREVMGAYAFAGQMQQTPTPRSGGFFEWEKFQIRDALPHIGRSVRYWDKAGTKDGGAYTAGVKMGVAQSGDYIVLDVVRGQWAAAERERVIRQTAEIDGTEVKVYVEQEPGSGGKESAEGTIRNLAGYTIEADRVTGAKELRAEPYAAQVAAGNIKLAAADWNKMFIDEHKTFPAGKYKDQIDAVSAAFAKLATGKHPRVRAL